MGRHDERPRLQSLLTNEPGVVVNNPRRQLAKLLVLYALLPLIAAGAGAYTTYSLATAAMDRRVDALEADLAQRRTAAAEANEARDRALQQYRRDLCVVIDRAQPRDQQVEVLRRRYGCVGNPAPAPSASTSAPSSGPAGRGGTRPTASVRPAPAPAAPANPPAGQPGPPPPSGPPGPAAPAPGPSVGVHLEVCVPLIDLCVL